MSSRSLVVAFGLGVASLAVHPPVATAARTWRVSISSTGAQANGVSAGARLTADGRYVAFSSDALNLVAGDTNTTTDIFVRDSARGVTERISVSSAGAQANGRSWAPALSADGRYIAFESRASNLVAGDTNNATDVFVRDRARRLTERVSFDSAGRQATYDAVDRPALNADGRYVAFSYLQGGLDPTDVFVRDRRGGVTERVSASTGAEGSPSLAPALSADGRYVAFHSFAALVMGDTNNSEDIFIRDRLRGVTERVSLDSAGAQANDDSTNPALSADGRYVAFTSSASNLVTNDLNTNLDVFVRDRLRRVTERVSRNTAGAQANGDSWAPALNADGRYVAFDSSASRLVPGDSNNTEDIFLRDRLRGVTERVSLDSTGAQANGYSTGSALSADGRYVAFTSWASNLVAGDTNNTTDIFVRRR